jgi:DNA-binding Xre family transcriptional regulator
VENPFSANVKTTMFVANLTEIRTSRQINTNRCLAEELAYSDVNEKNLKKLLNFKALDRLCDLMDCSRKDIYDKCQGNYEFALVVAHGCSVQSSRQGTKDESYVLSKLSTVFEHCGIFIKSLKTDELRPTRDGKLLSKEQFKQSGLTRLDCLKSVDAEISGRVNGFIFAKVVLGAGGHQDNVFHEATQFGEWAQCHGKKGKKYVILIDTDQKKSYNNLKSRFDSDDIWVVDHIEFQQRIGAYV